MQGEESIMKLKLSIFTLLFLSSLTPIPAQADIWDTIRNSALITTVFGRFPETNYTAQTRLPIIEVQSSFWSRISNFFTWRHFRTKNQPPQDSAPASAPRSNRYSNSTPNIAGRILSHQLAQLQIQHHTRLLQSSTAENLKLKKELNESFRIQENNNLQNREIIKVVNNFDHQMTSVADRFAHADNRLTSMNNKVESCKKKLKALHQKHIIPTINQPALPISIVSSNKLCLSELVHQHTVSAHAEIPIGLLQSSLPALQTSIISKEVDSFSELPLSASSSPEPNEKIETHEIYNKLQIDQCFYTDQVSKGREYADAIYENRLDNIPTKTQQEYLQSIIALNWHLYDLALQKGQGFVEGTFVLEDTEFKLYNFLMAYTRRMNPEVKGTHLDPLLHVSHNPFAYSRDASHYKHLKMQYRPYGIDIRFGADKKSEALLPAYKRHILFGKIDEETNLFYLKIENFGIHTSDVLDHAREFAAAQVGKNNICAGSIRTIAGWFGYAIPTDSGDGNQKERIVPAFLEDFDEIVSAAEMLTKDQKLMHMGYARIEGFKTLYNTSLTSAVHGIKTLAQKYENHPKKYDHMRWRTGEEVIHSQNQWVPRLALRNGNPNK